MAKGHVFFIIQNLSSPSVVEISLSFCPPPGRALSLVEKQLVLGCYSNPAALFMRPWPVCFHSGDASCFESISSPRGRGIQRKPKGIDTNCDEMQLLYRCTYDTSSDRELQTLTSITFLLEQYFFSSSGRERMIWIGQGQRARRIILRCDIVGASLLLEFFGVNPAYLRFYMLLRICINRFNVTCPVLRRWLLWIRLPILLTHQSRTLTQYGRHKLEMS